MSLLSTLTSLFTSKASAVESAEASARTSETKLVAKRSQVATLAKDLDDATGATSEARVVLAAAESAYADDPKPGTVKAVREAREALELALLRERKPRERHEAAAAELVAMEAAHAAEIEAVEAARREARKAELLELVTAASFRQDVAEDVASYLDLEDQKLECLRSIEAKIGVRTAAVQELRGLGEQVGIFDAAHGALAIFVERVRRGGPIRGDAAEAVQMIRNAFGRSEETRPGSLAWMTDDLRKRRLDKQALDVQLFVDRSVPCAPENRAAVIEDLEVASSFADLRQGIEAVTEARRARGKAEYAKAPPPRLVARASLGGIPLGDDLSPLARQRARADGGATGFAAPPPVNDDQGDAS